MVTLLDGKLLQAAVITHLKLETNTPAFILACFFAHAPVSALGILTGRPFFVSTHADDPTTGVGIVGGGGLTLTGRGRQRGLLVLSSGGTGHQCVVGYPGRVCGLRCGLVEVYVSGKIEGGRPRRNVQAVIWTPVFI
jgi:hypothetical protein